MICDACMIEHSDRPWIMADVISGETHSYCEKCAVIKIDEYIATKKKSFEQARNN